MKCSAVVNFLMLLKLIPVSKTIAGKAKIALLHPVNILQFIAFCVCYGVYIYTICQVRYWGLLYCSFNFNIALASVSALANFVFNHSV